MVLPPALAASLRTPPPLPVDYAGRQGARAVLPSGQAVSVDYAGRDGGRSLLPAGLAAAVQPQPASGQTTLLLSFDLLGSPVVSAPVASDALEQAVMGVVRNQEWFTWVGRPAITRNPNLDATITMSYRAVLQTNASTPDGMNALRAYVLNDVARAVASVTSWRMTEITLRPYSEATDGALSRWSSGQAANTASRDAASPVGLVLPENPTNPTESGLLWLRNHTGLMIGVGVAVVGTVALLPLLPALITTVSTWRAARRAAAAEAPAPPPPAP